MAKNIPPLSACLLLLDGNGRPLVVDRKSGQGVCLPGGKADEGETIERTGARELEEETGLRVREEDMTLIHTGWCTSESGPDYWTHTFQARRWEGKLGGGEPQLRARWGSWADLLESSPFADYNRQVYDLMTNQPPPETGA